MAKKCAGLHPFLCDRRATHHVQRQGPLSHADLCSIHAKECVEKYGYTMERLRRKPRSK